MHDRPFSSEDIFSLEKHFEESKGSTEKLETLLHELTCRKTKRAHQLQEKIERLLENVSAVSNTQSEPERELKIVTSLDDYYAPVEAADHKKTIDNKPEKHPVCLDCVRGTFSKNL